MVEARRQAKQQPLSTRLLNATPLLLHLVILKYVFPNVIAGNNASPGSSAAAGSQQSTAATAAHDQGALISFPLFCW